MGLRETFRDQAEAALDTYFDNVPYQVRYRRLLGSPYHPITNPRPSDDGYEEQDIQTAVVEFKEEQAQALGAKPEDRMAIFAGKRFEYLFGAGARPAVSDKIELVRNSDQWWEVQRVMTDAVDAAYRLHMKRPS